MKWLLGIDGGATKTEAILIDEKLEKIALTYVGPSNYQTVGLRKAIKNIEKATLQVCHSLGISPPIDIACIALAGINSKLDYKNLMRELSKIPLWIKLKLVHDGEAALYAASMCKGGIIVILGTGSLVAAYDKTNKYIRSCNWGHLLGDEGSAYRIAIRALSRLLKGYDGRMERLKTEKEILKALNIEEPTDIASLLYTEWNNEDVARLTPVILEKAKEDEELLKIIEEEAYNIAECVKIISEKTGWKEVYLTGGLSKNHLYASLVEKKIKSLIKDAVVKVLEVKPILGAIGIAMKEEGLSEDEYKRLTLKLKNF